jgi:hypothetical protein
MRPDHHLTWGDSVNRRFALILAALASTTSLVLAACGGAPAAPAVTDPKEILTQTVLSLKDVKTIEMTGSMTGTLQAAELGGTLDLSSVKINAALDIPNQKGKVNVDAPTVLGTKVDAIFVDGAAYLKVDGLLSSMMGAGLTPGKYTKTDIPKSSGEAVTNPAEIAKGVDAFKAALDKLPTPPTKGPDEKCGDQDCYHVTLKVTAADLATLGSDAGAFDGEMSIDVWSRKSDVRPAKVAFSMTSSQIGTIGMTFEFKYDVNVAVDAPPADQIAP